MKKLLFLFIFLISLIKSSENNSLDAILQDAKLIHVADRYIGGGSYFPIYAQNK